MIGIPPKLLNQLSAALALVFVLSGCSEQADTTMPLRPVLASRVDDASALEGRWLPGRAQAAVAVNLSFRVGGPLVDRPVDVGSVVKQGDLLARVDPRDYQVRVRDIEGQLQRARAELSAMETGARPEDLEVLRANVASAKSGLRLAEFQYNKTKELAQSNSASPHELEVDRASWANAKADVRTAEENLHVGERGARAEDIDAKQGQIRSIDASLQAARDALEDTNLLAPFGGTAAQVFVENHEIVQPRQPIVRLINDSSIEMTVGIPEGSIALLSRVVEVVCRFDALPGHTFKAIITEVGLEASETTRTYPVTVAISQTPDVRILPGMAGEAMGRFASIEEEGGRLVVPSSAVIPSKGDEAFVWVIEGVTNASNIGRAKMHKIRQIEVLRYGIRVEGLERGMWVATAGVNTITEGQEVRVLDAGLTAGAPQ